MCRYTTLWNVKYLKSNNFCTCFQKFCLFIKNFMTIRVGRLTSDVVLFSIAALKRLAISQGSVATPLTCGAIFSYSIIILWQILRIVTVTYFENRLMFGKVKAYKNGANFWGHPVSHQPYHAIFLLLNVVAYSSRPVASAQFALQFLIWNNT